MNMNFRSDWRDRRNFLNQGISFGTMQYTIANYSSDARIGKKTDLESFDEEILTKISSIPDPLKKNLADTVITNNNKRNMPPENKEYFCNTLPPVNEPETNRNEFSQSFSGITNFISNVFGAISDAVFHRRPKSPVTQYYDCLDCDSLVGHEMAPEFWQEAKTGDQNKIQAPDLVSRELIDNMNNCHAAVSHCEDKLNAVRNLLKNKSVPTSQSTRKLRPRRPRRAFIEPSSVESGYEADFTADNYVSLANDEYVEYFALPNVHTQDLSEIDAPKMKTEYRKPENTDIVKILPEVTEKPEIPPVIPESEIKKEIILSCEDKMAKLKSLLLEKRKKPVKINLHDSTDSIVEPVKEKPPKKPTKVIPIDKKQDKRFKNPNRLAEKRTRSRMRKNIHDDMVFAHEIDSEEISSVDNSPAPVSLMQRVSETPVGSVESIEYFDELKGRFHSASTTDSEDSFQIVFTDSLKPTRVWKPSECDSEDSFIVFEDSPDSCYTSNDVFGDNDSEVSDTDSEISDSGCALDVCKLSHSLSRTVSDLTDDTLYEDTQIAKPVEIDTIPECTEPPVEFITIDETTGPCVDGDEVDCAVRTFDEISTQDIQSDKSVLPSLLINETKKLQRKNQPAKKVSFSEKPPKVHVMRVWSFAARQARAGHWERHALDRERFKRRIADVDMAVSWVLKPQHRSRVMFQRFMPWWNQQKRKEAAEKKLRLEEEKKRAEEETERKRIEMEKLEEGKECDKQNTIEDVDKEMNAEEAEAKRMANEKQTTVDGIERQQNTIEGEKQNTIASELEKVGEGKQETFADVRKEKGVRDGEKEMVSKKKDVICNSSVENNVNGRNEEIIAISDKLADLNVGFIAKENIMT